MERFDGDALIASIRLEWAGVPSPNVSQRLVEMVGHMSTVAKIASELEILLAGQHFGWNEKFVELGKSSFVLAVCGLENWTLPPVPLASLRRSHLEPVSHARSSGQSYTEVAASLRSTLLEEIERNSLATSDDDSQAEWANRFSLWFGPESIWRLNVTRDLATKLRDRSNVQEADFAYVRIDRAFEPLVAGTQLEFNAVAAARKDLRLELERVRAPLDAMLGNMVAIHQMFVSSHVGLSTGREERTFHWNRSQIAEQVAAFDSAFPMVRPLFRSQHSAAVTTLGRSSACFAEAVRLHASNHLHARKIEDLEEGSGFLGMHPEYSIWQPSNAPVTPKGPSAPVPGHLGLIVNESEGTVGRTGTRCVVSFEPGSAQFHTFKVAYLAGDVGATEEEWMKGYAADQRSRREVRKKMNKKIEPLGIKTSEDFPMKLQEIRRP